MDFEKEGLRIKLTKDRKATGQVGVFTNFPIKGNFEITAAYEILHADQPTEGWGVGTTLFIYAEETNKDAAGIYRLNLPKGAQAMKWNSIVMRDGQRDAKGNRIACDAKIFRLRMTRSRRTLTCFWAPGLAGNDFREIGRTEEFFGGDITSVVLNTTTGNQRHDLDARFVDLRIRSSVKSLSGPEVASSAVERVQRRWRLLLVVLLVGIALSAGLLTWVLRRHRQIADGSKT
jgi:hypothetical protein